MCNETKNRDRSRRDTMAKYDFYTFDKMIFYKINVKALWNTDVAISESL